MRRESTRLNYWRRRAVKREYVQKIKTETPCADCGNRYHYAVMDFDHVRGEKRYTMGKLCASNLSLDYLLDEIAKCDVVCANCHRLRTFARKYWMVPGSEPQRTRNHKPRSDIKEIVVSPTLKPS